MEWHRIELGFPAIDLFYLTRLVEEDTLKVSAMNMRAWDQRRGISVIADLQRLPGALLPILHALQEEFGYIEQAAVPLLAAALNLSEAEVHGVVSFYPDFRTAPPGRHVLRICRAEACQSMGCDALISSIENRFGVKLGKTTSGREISTEPVFCLGNCARAPSIMLDGEVYGCLSKDGLNTLIDGLEKSE
jgi:formate dehydrogenase subunit gamma